MTLLPVSNKAVPLVVVVGVGSEGVVVFGCEVAQLLKTRQDIIINENNKGKNFSLIILVSFPYLNIY